ncbi:MAG: hypothetical protein SO101_05600 [Lachnospiraceae bacterium]|nr:hypothetical protein [Lachnospiraceae bacterium]
MMIIKNKNRTGGYRKCYLPCGAMMFLYILQFLVFPRLFPVYFRTSNESTAMYYISTAVVILAVSWIAEPGIVRWIAGDMIYLFLVFLYSSDGAYGWNTGIMRKVHDWKLMGLELTVCAVMLLVFQCIAAAAVRIFRKVK